MLIDTNGKVVFKGHPACRENLEEDIDTLLKGATLEVEELDDEEEEPE